MLANPSEDKQTLWHSRQFYISAAIQILCTMSHSRHASGINIQISLLRYYTNAGSCYGRLQVVKQIDTARITVRPARNTSHCSRWGGYFTRKTYNDHCWENIQLGEMSHSGEGGFHQPTIHSSHTALVSMDIFSCWGLGSWFQISTLCISVGKVFNYRRTCD